MFTGDESSSPITDERAGRIRQPLAVAMGVMGAWMLVMPASAVTLALSVSHAGGSTRDYSVGLSLGWLTLTVMSISFAALSDRIRARQPRRIGALILVALTACLAVSLVLDAGTSPSVIVVAWIILQIPASAILGAAMSQAAAVADPRRRGIVSGLVGSAALLALMVGAPLALAAGPRLSFTAAAIGGSVLLVPLLRLVSRQMPTPVLTAPTSAVRSHPRSRAPWLVLLGIGFFLSVATAITNSYVVAITSSVLSIGGSQVSAESLATLAIDGTGVWVIGTGANRFKGDIRIDAGTGSTIGLENASLPSGATLAVANNATIRWEAGNTTGVKLEIVAGTAAKLNLGANTVEFTAAPTVASGTGTTATFEKQGAGTLKIASTVSAPSVNVDVSSGLLAVNGTLGNVSLASGSTLGGAGIVGDVAAVSGSTIGPGNSPGTLTASSLAMFGGSNFEWQVQDAQNHSTGYDKLAISGSLDLTGASATNKINFKISSLLGAGDGSTPGNPLNFGPPNGTSSIRVFNFATVQGGASGVLLNAGENISDVFQFDVTQFTYTGGGTSNAGLWSIDWNQANGAITLTAVPEPSPYGFGLGALALAAAAIRRRRKNQPKA